MKYKYDYDVKDDLMELLQRKNDFSGAEELKYYFQVYQNEKNSIKKNLMKFCIYKLSANLTDVEIRSFDCDVSKGIIESFQKTYSWLENSICQNQKDWNGNNSPVKYELFSGNTSFRGDTMTSIWTTLKEYIKLKTCVSKINENDTWEMFILRECQRINLSFNAGLFLELGHSIGNFIPVPQGFNVGRSNWGKWDYWDLTLYQIYQWYRDNSVQRGYYNNQALETLFRNDRNKQTSIEYCMLWLERFETWENFVKQNCMESFVDKKGIPKRFFKNHSLSYPIPRTIKEFEEFFKTVNECITSRGKSIINILREKGYIAVEETEEIENKTESRNIQRIKEFVGNLRPVVYLKCLIEDLHEDFIGHFGKAMAVLSLILALAYAFILWIGYLFSGGYVRQFKALKEFKFSELWEFQGTTISNYLDNLAGTIFLILLAVALFGICVKGVYQRTGIKKKILSVFSLISWIGTALCVLLYIAVHYFLRSDMGWAWAGKIGYIKASSIFNVLLVALGAVSLVMAVPWLISIIINCFLRSTRNDFLLWLSTLATMFMVIPIILFVLENMVGVLVFLVIMKVLCVVLFHKKSDDETKVKLYDENGNLIGVIEKNQEDIDQKL